MTVYKPLRTLAREAAASAVQMAKGEKVEGTSTVDNGMKQVQAVLLNPTTIHKDLLPDPDQRQLLYEGAGVRDCRAEIGQRRGAVSSRRLSCAAIATRMSPRWNRTPTTATTRPMPSLPFAMLGAISLVVAIVSWSNGIARQSAESWRCMPGFFLGNASSFLYTTRRGKFQVWQEVLDGLHLRARQNACSRTWAAGAAPHSSPSREG